MKHLISPADQASSTLPDNITLSFDVLQKSVGFTNVHKVLKHMPEVAQDTVKIKDIGKSAIKNLGEVATLNRKPRTKTRQ